jgi:Asp-tRNA(Asn)/Glu-tRNA(Gln) amidotransferase A subunit family amidase
MLRDQRTQATLGRIPHASTVEATDIATIGMQLTQVNGLLARRVADLRRHSMLLPGQPGGTRGRCPPAPGPKPAMPVRAAMVLDPAGQGTASQVQDGVRKAANALEQAGYVVNEVEPPGIAAAANALVLMLTSPGIRSVWQQVMRDGAGPEVVVQGGHLMLKPLTPIPAMRRVTGGLAVGTAAVTIRSILHHRGSVGT